MEVCLQRGAMGAALEVVASGVGVDFLFRLGDVPVDEAASGTVACLG
ncbi:hypothetical protein [Streptomyces youssoufiensis]